MTRIIPTRNRPVTPSSEIGASSRHRPIPFNPPTGGGGDVAALAAHVDAVEAASIDADADLDARLDIVETQQTSDDSRLDALEAADVALDARLDAVEAQNVTDDSRLDTLDEEAGGTAPAFPTLAATIYERWKFYGPHITLVDGRISLVTGIINGRTWAQATAANRPYYYPRRFNGGYGCAFFSGRAGGASRMIHTPTATKAIPFSMIAILEDYTGGVGNQNFVNTGSIIWFTSAGNWVCYAGNVAQHTTSGALGSTTPLLDGGTKHPDIGVMVWNGASSVVNAYGTKQTVNSGAAANALTNAVNVVLGDDGAGTGWARLKLRELIFVEGTITDPEIALLRTWASHPRIAGIPSPI